MCCLSLGDKPCLIVCLLIVKVYNQYAILNLTLFLICDFAICRLCLSASWFISQNHSFTHQSKFSMIPTVFVSRGVFLIHWRALRVVRSMYNTRIGHRYIEYVTPSCRGVFDQSSDVTGYVPFDTGGTKRPIYILSNVKVRPSFVAIFSQSSDGKPIYCEERDEKHDSTIVTEKCEPMVQTSKTVSSSPKSEATFCSREHDEQVCQVSSPDSLSA